MKETDKNNTLPAHRDIRLVTEWKLGYLAGLRAAYKLMSEWNSRYAAPSQIEEEILYEIKRLEETWR